MGSGGFCFCGAPPPLTMRLRMWCTVLVPSINYTYRDDERGHIVQMSYDNRQAFDQEILSGDAAICFLSPELFEIVAKEGAFIPVSGYAVAVPEGGRGSK